MQILLLCGVPVNTTTISRRCFPLVTLSQLFFFRLIGSCVANIYIFMLPGMKYVLLYFIISSNYHRFLIIIIYNADCIIKCMICFCIEAYR
jgi:hypothetical protein